MITTGKDDADHGPTLRLLTSPPPLGVDKDNDREDHSHRDRDRDRGEISTHNLRPRYCR